MTSKQSTPKQPPLTSLDAMDEAAELLKTLAHPHRLRIVQMLLRGRYTVGELAESCGIPSHMASEHLRLMLRCSLLYSHKEGRCTATRKAARCFTGSQNRNWGTSLLALKGVLEAG